MLDEDWLRDVECLSLVRVYPIPLLQELRRPELPRLVS